MKKILCPTDFSDASQNAIAYAAKLAQVAEPRLVLFTDSTNDNFDIYLPNWLAKHNKQIYATIVLITIIGLIFRLFGK